ncbi:hypothetical protein FH972_021647 [Carpinus fangiana]|uniref:non-specific serine/threonine protein kinase n=1 Tax=Carpinus fangiana TaxID=176857 RepID=A0A5N6KPX3_9ROSI|nr:hypothetical protein FH972_021647 [Carpinus fangiana]
MSSQRNSDSEPFLHRTRNRDVHHARQNDGRFQSSNHGMSRRLRDEATPPPQSPRRSRSPSRNHSRRERSPNHSYQHKDDGLNHAPDNRREGMQLVAHGSGRRGPAGYRTKSNGSVARQSSGISVGGQEQQEGTKMGVVGLQQHEGSKIVETLLPQQLNADGTDMPSLRDSAEDVLTVEVTVEERRKRREAIRAKHIISVPDALNTGLMLENELDVAPPISEKAAASVNEQPVLDDMFASDNDDDMFAEVTSRKLTPDPERIEAMADMENALADNWDDPNGYYRFTKDEILDSRYKLLDSHGLGKGMFSNVVRASDISTDSLVAIKIIRNNESMRKAAMKEMRILEKLAEEDPGDEKHIIRLHRSFMHKGHLCMVFENLSQDLRELLKKFGRDQGFDMSAIRTYARQLFLGLQLLQQSNIIHADLKPDNILACAAPHSIIKICDLGSAFDASEAGDTPELASRFYRAPEVMLGIPYDFGIDMWSIGCTLFELFTGHILFTGSTNNQMLRAIMECRGMLTARFVERGEHSFEHFEPNPHLAFRSVEVDPTSGMERARLIQTFKRPEKELRAMLLAANPDLTARVDKKPTFTEKLEQEKKVKELNCFADLLDKCLKTNPEHRIRPIDALQHDFFGNMHAGLTPKFKPAFSRPAAAPKKT